MMTPTHACTSSAGPRAGLSAERDPAVQRCSMGAGAGTLCALISLSSASMYSMSRVTPLRAASLPTGNAVSSTHCCPPQSKPSTSSLHPTRTPADAAQHAASAAFTAATQSLSSGASSSAASRSAARLVACDAEPGPARASTRALSGCSLRACSCSLTGCSAAGPARASAALASGWPAGLLRTTTTLSVYGSHMYRRWRYSRSQAAWCFLTSARLAVSVSSTSWCASTHCSVTSVTTPSPPSPTLASANSSGSLSADRLRVPSPGVASLRPTTWSSTGGMAAPVPCAPTCVKPPTCWSRMLA
mmetsp:Transcript_29097/g.74253  ORF Transcript_29097/g.74253 Transcript_29097/m.74253 type:complete len:302 (+) Transcript_29097:588-1493(+)